MGTSRMYADSNGNTTWQPIVLEEHPEWIEGFDAKDIKFGIRPADVEQDWHPAPKRQFVIILSGISSIVFFEVPFQSYIIIASIIALTGAMVLIKIKK